MKKFEKPIQNPPVPANRAVVASSVKVRALRPLSEEIDGVMYRFTTGDEFTLPPGRVAALGPFVQRVALLLIYLLPFAFSLSASAAPAGYLSKTNSGTTSATVLFPGGNNEARVVTLDVTSDKAASVVAWRVGTTEQMLAAPAAIADTNLYFLSSTVVSNDVLLVQTAANLVTNYTVYTNVSLTNAQMFLNKPLGTNLAAGDTLKKILTDGYTLSTDASATTTNYVLSTATNGLASNDTLIVYYDGAIKTNRIYSVLSNSFNVFTTLGTNLAAGAIFYKLTNTYTTIIPTTRLDSYVVTGSSTNLSAGDQVLVLPATGGYFPFTVSTTNQLILSKVTTTAAGFALARDDKAYLRSTATTTPVGAATVRLYGNAVFLGPPGKPCQAILDGTSACAINQIIIDYGK